MYNKEVLEIFKRLQILTSLYEKIRFVDPTRKKVLTYENGALKELEHNCYDNWKRERFCINCISMRAFNEGKTFMKMEHNLKDIYTVTSIPIKLSNRNIVIELLQLASSSLGFDNCDSNLQTNMYSTIDHMNKILLKDSLTDIYNRRFINEVLPVDMAISSALNNDFSIIISDIDFFKKINDNYGHVAGDSILRQFTSVLKKHISDDDWIARYGGEEFIIGVHSTKESAVTIAENMRKTVEKHVFSHEEKNIKVTASFGVCSINDIEDYSVSNLIGFADKKLYVAKSNGRNRVQS